MAAKKKPFAIPILGEYSIAAIGQHKNELLYRGYSIHDIMKNDCCYEEIVHLILRGHLPNKQQLSQYKHKMASYRIPSKLIHFLNDIKEPNMDCIDYLKLAIAYLGIIKSKTNESMRDRMDEIIALMPLFLLSYRHNNLSSHQYTSNGAAETFLRLQNIQITNEMIDCLNKTMILYAEHGITTSAFTARVVTSSLSDIYSATCAALVQFSSNVYLQYNAFSVLPKDHCIVAPMLRHCISSKIMKKSPF